MGSGGRVGAWARGEPLVSGVGSLRGASGLPGGRGCFWRLWEAGRQRWCGGGQARSPAHPETEGEAGLWLRRAGSVLRGN